MRFGYLASLTMAMFCFVSCADAQYGPYSEAEFKCGAPALYYEGGSTRVTYEEQAIMIYSIMVRGKKAAADPNFKRDFGGWRTHRF